MNNMPINPLTGKTNEQVLAESTAVAQNAAQIAGVSYTPPTNFGSTPITSDIMNPQPDLSKQFVADPYALTPPQQDVQAQIKSLEQQISSLSGEGAFRAQKEGEQGIPEATKTLNDLLAQQQMVLNEQATIQLTAPGPGQGALPTAIIQRQQAEKLRTNAISALAINSLVAAAQGKLATARGFVDRAVAAQYDPIKARIDAAKQNLDLILRSPEYTNAEKKQAQAQKDIQDEKANKLEQEKENRKAIYNIALNAAEKGASAVILNEIQKAKTPDEALQIMAREIKTVAPSTEEQLYGGLSSATATAVRGRVSQFKTEPIIQNFATIQEGYVFASSLPDKTTNPADDQALIYSLAKALDPGSVVREGEYATAQKYAQSWIKSFGTGVEQAILGTGFLSEEARKNIKKTIESRFNASKTSYNNLYERYSSSIENLTGRNDGELFLIDYSLPVSLKKYSPGTHIESDGVLYLVQEDGETVEPIGSIKQ